MRKPGFTLLEMLLTVAAIALLSAVSFPVYQTFQLQQGSMLAATSLAQSLRRAQSLSQASLGDSRWGVKILPNSVIIFKGSSYASRDTSFDETTEFFVTISRSGADEYVFSKLLGMVLVPSSTVFTLPNGETKTVSVNSFGTIDY